MKKKATQYKAALEQAHARVHREIKREFFGTSYAYNIGALVGIKEVGVIRSASSGYFVGFYGKKPGVTVRLSVARLPCSHEPEELQAQLDDWAEKHGLIPIARIAGGVA